MSGRRAKIERRTRRPNVKETVQRAERRQFISFVCKFAFLSVLFLTPVSLLPEACFSPLNRITAHLAGNLLGLFAPMTSVRGTLIIINSFNVNVISECSAVHLVLLLSAFIITFPSTRRQKWVGLSFGIVLLLSMNIVRISAVTWIGSEFPALFEPVHIYLGQLGMMTGTVVLCLGWCRWVSDPVGLDGPLGFAVRFIVISAIPFLVWVPLNRLYLSAIDGFVTGLFRLASYHLVIPRTHVLYYQTFSIVALIGFLLSVKGAKPMQRLRWAIIGFCSLTLFQVAFRICNIWISAFKIGWMIFMSQIIYNFCVYGLPMALAMGFLMQVRMHRSSRDSWAE